MSKIKSRNKTFETNSSSTHSMAIPLRDEDCAKISHGAVFHFCVGEFGWEFDEVDACDYLYTAIVSCHDESAVEDRLNRIKSVVESHGCTAVFEGYNLDGWGYIDHQEDLGEFLKTVFSSDEMLWHFLTGGLVFTGNDNCTNEEFCFVYRQSPTYRVSEQYNATTREWTQKTEKNPYYEEKWEHYVWCTKEN